MIVQKKYNGLTLLVIESEYLRVEVVPDLGGKFTSVFNKDLEREFLWHNTLLPLEKQEAGADYDENFWGGIDELLPNDISEEVDGISYPDHGELWTTALDFRVHGKEIVLSGILPLSGLLYEKTVSLSDAGPEIHLRYRICNTTNDTRHFLWKHHAALHVNEGDRLQTPASLARVVYPVSSRFPDTGEILWPNIGGADASIIPPQDGTMDFFYLYGHSIGSMSMLSQNESARFGYEYDQTVFPYQWYFASFGQFRGHYTAILEPASAMPVCVNEAAALGQCSVLEAGEELNTAVTIYAGEN